VAVEHAGSGGAHGPLHLFLFAAARMDRFTCSCLLRL
jgi:hypothetical protein